MGIFSKELIEMDQNTVDFMIDEMQNTIDSLKTENTALASEKNLLLETIAQLKNQLAKSKV